MRTEHPQVRMAVGIGVPDPVLGEIGRYYVVLTPEAQLTEGELEHFCAGKIARLIARTALCGLVKGCLPMWRGVAEEGSGREPETGKLPPGTTYPRVSQGNPTGRNV
ncbi:hypothetical protein [Nocardia sp. NPDC047648]|uniref:AMP-binding enzyme n=1 Tax=Nocardia sp. NPDC047648 TaxID=3155625 RepID=UPI0033DDF257